MTTAERKEGIMETFTYGPLTMTDMVRYQGASGDFNLIHHDALGAQARGTRVVSPGMFQAGLMATWLDRALPEARVRSFTVRFTAPAHVGDTIEIEGAFDDEDPSLVLITCSVDDGSVVARGDARLESNDG